ncbi:malic enzyme [Phlyctema vagabunda]|uniref:Malic enzyme n=1 Tax=Phlyctema vagabunda TaxID=108571 RepID=A0ABR4PFV1_9HELO
MSVEQKASKANSKFSHLPLSTSGPQDCALVGSALLNTPYLNKGSAFTAEERENFGLYGLLPQAVMSLDQQVKRAYQQYSTRSDDLAKNTFMTSMKEQNEVLYYKLIQEHLKEMFSIIYTPTEGEAIQNFSKLFRRPEGCFLNIEDIDRIHHDLSQWGHPEDIDYIVVTDGEEILGIGDQGVGGILISVAKLVLTTLCAGIHPNRTLAVVLDCGTDNEDLRNDPIYLGLNKPRVRGKKYDEFVDTFVKSARELFPRAYIHFEDFGLPNARRILDKYRPTIPCFNDDVQGTGCVTLAAVTAGLHVSNIKLTDMRMVIFGCVDKPGLLLKSQGGKLTPAQVEYAREDNDWEGKDHSDLLSVIKEVKPHVLIGTSTKPKAFTKDIVQEMASHVERPIIFPLSNPTRLHEADPKDISEWTKGKALIATGSPFPPVEYDGKKYEVAECNNSTCFPGIGLGCVLARVKLLSDKMLVSAVKALAAQSPALKDPSKGLLPDVINVREISVHIARAVIKQAVEEGLAQEKGIPDDDEELEEWIREQMWDPVYRPLRRVEVNSASRHAKGELGIAGDAAS